MSNQGQITIGKSVLTYIGFPDGTYRVGVTNITGDQYQFVCQNPSDLAANITSFCSANSI